MSDQKRVVTISYEDALYLEGIMIWVRDHSPTGEEPNEEFRKVELRLNMAVANSMPIATSQTEVISENLE